VRREAEDSSGRQESARNFRDEKNWSALHRGRRKVGRKKETFFVSFRKKRGASSRNLRKRGRSAQRKRGTESSAKKQIRKEGRSFLIYSDGPRGAVDPNIRKSVTETLQGFHSHRKTSTFDDKTSHLSVEQRRGRERNLDYQKRRRRRDPEV